jgi:hypothetical protein
MKLEYQSSWARLIRPASSIEIFFFQRGGKKTGKKWAITKERVSSLFNI